MNSNCSDILFSFKKLHSKQLKKHFKHEHKILKAYVNHSSRSNVCGISILFSISYSDFWCLMTIYIFTLRNYHHLYFFIYMYRNIWIINVEIYLQSNQTNLSNKYFMYHLICIPYVITSFENDTTVISSLKRATKAMKKW